MSLAADVLVIDDDSLIRSLIRDALDDVPCEVRESVSGSDGLAALATKAPEVVLLDLLLPDVSGLELLRHIKTAAPSAKVFVISALDSEALVQQALEHGAQGFLTKPFHKLDVQNLVRSALEKPRRLVSP
jgi:CheY-like chemotaxis protein